MPCVVPLWIEPFVQSYEGYFRRDSPVDSTTYQIGDIVGEWQLRIAADSCGPFGRTGWLG
jgi:hypothetical protein